MTRNPDAALLARYVPPRPHASDVDDARLAHDDLHTLELDDLEHEHARVTVALAIRERIDLDRPWLVERLRRVRREIRLREKR